LSSGQAEKVTEEKDPRPPESGRGS
jgi:hypothetical protein